MKLNRKPPASMVLCAWCEEVVKVLDSAKGIVREMPLCESGFTVEDFARSGSHGICRACGEQLREEVEAIKNPAADLPAWVRDPVKWRKAVDLAMVSYGKKIGKKQVREIYAVIVTIYKNLGGRIKRKAQRNPSAREWQAVIDLFDKFHDFEPDSTIMFKVKSLRIPDVLVKLGDLHEVVYKSTKFDRKARLYVHRFGRNKPILAADEDGRLFIVGGDYKVTSRGIER